MSFRLSIPCNNADLKMCGNISFVALFELLVAFFFPNSAVFAFHVTDDNLYEGSKCTMANGSPGICRKLYDCPATVIKSHITGTGVTVKGRCGFSGYTEIVCCPPTIIRELPRPQPIGFTTPPTNNKVPGVNSPARISVERGYVANKTEFPYMAALGYRNDVQGKASFMYMCGGTLISTKHVLTAAHCVKNRINRTPVHVLLGTTDLVNIDPGAQLIGIDRIVTHHLYKTSSPYNDLAIIILMSNVKVNDGVKPIHLHMISLERTLTEDRAFKTIGFGVADDHHLATKLRATPPLSIVPRGECNASYEFLPLGIDTTLICAKDDNIIRSSDACCGDSGGPLVMMDNFEAISPILVGVTAFGILCDNIAPVVYTSVQLYLGWIGKFLWENTN